MSQAQAVDLTLTLTEVTVRPVQVWVRAAGPLDAAGKTITVYLAPPEGALVQVGQRARTFPVESRSSMFQARIRVPIFRRRGSFLTVQPGVPKASASSFMLRIL